ncbi:hypothetical protein [Pseudaestuariivita rosea]|nr:hypothetical protein [Pseudaestuariivita rosea]
MFRLIRIVFFIGAVFLAGMIYQMMQHRENCNQAGGRVSGGLCVGEDR